MQGAPPRLNHSIVRAGAGAGKTWGLVEKVVEVFRTFAAAGARPRVVVTTFTRKATQELKERLILKACELRDPRLLQFVSDPSSLQITTIHGLLNGFMRQVGHLAGLDAGFQIVGEAEASRQARLALRETLVEHPEGLTWLETYGFARALAMCRGYERAVREQGELSPAGIEELRALAEEERRRWSGVLKNLALSVREEVDDDKWRDFAAALLRFSSVWKGEGLDGVDLPSKPRNSKKQAHLQVWHERTEELLKDFKKEMAKPCWNQALWEDMVLAWEEFLPLGQAFAEKLKALKDREGRFEMVDLELKSLEMLREKPFLGSVFAENWDFWMIDEYQDTSPLQVAVLSALIGDRPKYVVGDPQQSIYLFRGAEVRVFDQAEREILSGGGEKRELLKNYRSRPDLLLWINDFMASIGEDFVAMDPRDPPAAPQRECARLVRARDPENELNAITAEVARHVNAGARLEQICVLGRTHRALMDVSKALRTAGYATHVHAARGFLERREVIDAQALWKFLVNPHDNLNLMILLRSPWFFVKDQTLGEWMERKPDSLWRRLMVVEDHESVSRLRKALQLVNARGVATAFEETLIEAAYLDLSLANDPAGRKESNLWKLIHRARRLEREQGVSVLDFLEGASDPMESSEGDATSAQEPNAINLMTIHGAKGLQFEHVIVPRMGESPRTSNAEPFAAQDGRYFFSLKDEETGEFVPSPLENVRVRDQRARELAEFDRWLYVAVTRAKSTLFLSWSEVGRESWAARGRWFALPAQRHSREHYCFDILEGEFTAVHAPAKPDEKMAARALWRKGGAGHDERHSVTDLVAAKARGMRRDGLLKRWQAQNTGTRLHRELQALKYAAPPVGDPAARFVLNLSDPPMRRILEAGEVEWGFQVRTPAGVIEGQIDLWGEVGGILYVVDYKSGSEDFKEAAFRQLSLYAWALRKFGHTANVKLVVIYPVIGKIDSRDFTGDLFDAWELEFSGTQA